MDTNEFEPKSKQSAIASILWQYVDELEARAHFWRETQDDPHQVSVACYVALNEQAQALKKVLEKNYVARG